MHFAITASDLVMGNRLENFKTVFFYVVLFILTVEYFKYWCASNYDRIHCNTSTSIYTQDGVNEFNRVVKVLSTGTSACDKDAQISTINRRILKIFKNYNRPQVYCINKNWDSLDGAVGYTTTIEDKEKLAALCDDELLVLGESLL
ncbi:sphingosine N-acyltransferase subunit LIP1 ASCRUDRAFT_78738 [Ascoidea rubescens DSM 1968]|uniref:Uncharacterized protein n=1 Tax=Ascoidea rubescens DSM 1968 TaxID=1344418 RepID=A0A1D2VPY7_9ASCO|nr:hypothetical protein ASCRUDRAFT_78738 [Ascoidea rubescens DSM 1968]ODV63693.1 hypothetical protein ASCRUDRAFT_78738 [Ascoidea rubescens DSM 1968]